MGVNINVSITTQIKRGDNMSKNKREKKHPRYYALAAYQMLEKFTDDYMATFLGVSKRTYKDKVNGYSDFTPAEALAISQLLKKSQDEIFLT